MRHRTKSTPACVAMAIIALWPGLALTRPARSDLREAMLLIYVHGVDDELAEDVVAESDLPQLRRMLFDPSFPRRDNVVAFLAHRDGPQAVRPLLDLLADPPISLEVPEEERAVLLVPQALGQLARRGSAEALTSLLAMTGEAPSWHLSRAASRAADSNAFLSDLQESALRGLALSGDPEARARLMEVASGKIRLSGASRDMSGFASDAVELFDQQTPGSHGGAAGPPATERTDPPVAPLDGNSAVDLAPKGNSDVSVNLVDTQGFSHDSPLSFANHVSVPSPMTDVQATAVLRQASLRAAREDFADDVRCCVSVSKSGTARSFGAAGDGLDIIDNTTELSTVLNNPVSRVKVVRQINWCGQPGTNFIGCAWRPGFGMAVVRFSPTTSEGALWMHEWGHNTGLAHSTDSRAIMYGTLGTAALLTQAECNSYHTPNGAAGMTPIVTGVCSDADNDLIASSADNCPAVANNNQADGDADGLGDVCDPCPTIPTPAPPTLLSPANGATGVNGTPLLDWSDVSGVTSYQVQVATDADFANVVASTNLGQSAWTVTPRLTAGTTHYWRVRAVTACGTTSYSAVSSFTTCALASPSPVSPDNGANVSVVALSFDWSDVPGITLYELQVATDAAFTNVVRFATTSFSASTVTPELDPGTTYFWRVRCWNSCGNSLYSTVRQINTCPAEVTTPTSPPDGSMVATYSPVLDFADVVGGTSYTIEVALDPGFTSIARTGTSSTSSWTVTPALRGSLTPYYWRVRSRAACGTSAPSAAVSFTICPPPPAAANLWQDVAPLPQGPRAEPAVIYDPVRHRTLVFGGCGGPFCDRTPAPLTNDLRAYDHWTGQWSTVATAGTPPSPRMGAKAVYDPIRDRMLLFGGRDWNEDNTTFNDSYALSLSGTPTWSPLGGTGTSPNFPVGFAWAVYDSARDRLIVGVYSSRLYYALDLPTMVWTSRTSPNWANPNHPITQGGSMIYDPVNDRIVSFGGEWNYQSRYFTNDTSEMRLNAATPDWVNLPAAGGLPSSRAYHTSVYDAVNRRMLVFGGWAGVEYGDSPQFNDAWQLTLPLSGTPTWSLMSTPTAVPPRMGHSAVAAPGEMISFGGGAYRGSPPLFDNLKLNHDLTPPAAVTSLNAALGANDASVTWVESGDDSGSGRPVCFDLRKHDAPIDASNFGSATTVVQTGALPAGSTESRYVSGLQACSANHFAVKVIDDKGNSSLSNSSGGTTTCPPVATITGPSGVPSGVTKSWTGSGSGGTTPYVFRWYTGPYSCLGSWTLRSSATTFSTSSISDFCIKLEVQGANGMIGTATLPVDVGYIDCGPACFNLAPGKYVASSGLWDAENSPAEKLNDDNTGTTSACEGPDGYCAIACDPGHAQAIGNFFQIDLGGIKSVNSVTVYGRRDTAFTQGQDLKLRLSRDGLSWFDYFMEDTTSPDGFTVPTGRLARYVKVETTTVVYLSLYEVKVMGPSTCGNGICEPGDGEWCDSCPYDCAFTTLDLSQNECVMCDTTGEIRCGPGMSLWCCY